MDENEHGICTGGAVIDVAGLVGGDVAEVCADPSLAHALFGWRAELDVDATCRDAWLCSR